MQHRTRTFWDEEARRLVVDCRKAVDGLAKLLRRVEAGLVQSTSARDANQHFNWFSHEAQTEV